MGLIELYEHPNFSEWLILILILMFGSYAALKIKNEKNQYLRTARLVDLNCFSLLVPSWWSVTSDEDDFLKFERTDTRYDWYATFKVIEKDEVPTEAKLQSMIQEYKIKFDEGFEVENLRLLNEQKGFEISRREGMATRNGIERTYVDLAVIDYKEKDY